MANRGWSETQGGSSVASNARQTGRTSGPGVSQSFIDGMSKQAHPDGGDCDPLDSVGDLFEAPGNLTVPSGRGR